VVRARIGDPRCPGVDKPGLKSGQASLWDTAHAILDSFAPDRRANDFSYSQGLDETRASLVLASWPPIREKMHLFHE
jgi:hypothetical protein